MSLKTFYKKKHPLFCGPGRGPFFKK